MLKLRFVDRSNEETYKAYRLEVKRRLHAAHAEDLDAIASADRRKAMLANLYVSLEAHYDKVLRRCTRASVLP
jgi:histone acetyltransferase 1